MCLIGNKQIIKKNNTRALKKEKKKKKKKKFCLKVVCFVSFRKVQ